MVIYFILMFVKVNIIKGLISFNPMMFYKGVLGRIVPTTIVSFILPSIIYFNMEASLIRTLVVIAVSGLSTVASIYYIGMTKNEQQRVFHMLMKKIRK